MKNNKIIALILTLGLSTPSVYAWGGATKQVQKPADPVSRLDRLKEGTLSDLANTVFVGDVATFSLSNVLALCFTGAFRKYCYKQSHGINYSSVGAAALVGLPTGAAWSLLWLSLYSLSHKKSGPKYKMTTFFNKGVLIRRLLFVLLSWTAVAGIDYRKFVSEFDKHNTTQGSLLVGELLGAQAMSAFLFYWYTG